MRSNTREASVITMTDQAVIDSSSVLSTTTAHTRDAVWKSSPLIDIYLDHIRDAMPMHQRQIEVMTRLVATKRATVTRFLDLGCGDGILSAALLRRYPAAQGVLADVSEQMLGTARRKLQGSAAQLAFLNLNLGSSAWRAAAAPHGPFDVVVSGYAIHHLSDGGKQQVYRAIYDLLAPGGLFINIEYVAAATPCDQDMFVDYLIDHVAVAKQVQSDSMPREQLSGVINALMYTPDDQPAPVDQQCAWLREIGFSGVDCFFKLFGFAVFGGQRPAR